MEGILTLDIIPQGITYRRKHPWFLMTLEIEANLKPVDEQNSNTGANISEGARSDIRIMSFDMHFRNTHMDVNVINLQADTHKTHYPIEAITKA